MTEMTDMHGRLPPPVRQLVLHWGEMGQVWGVNRSVGQIHALLYLADAPMTAEVIADTLGLARSNVSNSIKELVGWGLVRRVHVLGDRRDFFAAEVDLWEMVTRIAEGRKAREMDPTIAVLKACNSAAGSDPATSPIAKKRIADMLEFVVLLDGWARDIRKVPRPQLRALMKLGAAVARFLPVRGGKRSA